MRPVHWIEQELARHYDDLDLSRGVDLDRNGTIEGSEKTDQNGDGDVDSAEWQKFMGDNRAALERLGGFFKTYYSAGTAFKLDNIIHDRLWLESKQLPSEEVERTYEKLTEILNLVKNEISKYVNYNARDKFRLPYYAIVEVGLEYAIDGKTSSFVELINEGDLNCNSFGISMIVIAHEFDWPVYLVRARRHLFVRWDNGKKAKYNKERDGVQISDSDYKDIFDIWEAAERGIFLKNLNYDELLSRHYHDSGMMHVMAKRWDKAIEDFTRAIDLDPNNVSAFTNRGGANDELKRYEEAIEDYNRAIELDPNNAYTYYNRSLAKEKLGMDDEADADYAYAKKLMPDLRPNYSCLCEAPGHTPSPDHSLLSLLMMIVFD